MSKPFLITKSRYVECYSCPLKLWLYKYKPDMKQELSLSDQLNMDQGKVVGQLATTIDRFKGGKEIPTRNKSVAVSSTKKQIEAKTKILYEASFKHDIAFCQADIMTFEENGFVDLYEVKASNKVKKHHLIDIAFQKWIIEKNGLKVRHCYLVHFNTSYFFNKTLDVNTLFECENVDNDILLYYNEVEVRLEEMKVTLSSPIEPKYAVGGHCNSPYACPFASYCNKSFNEDSVENLARLSDKKRKILNEKNIKYIKDIPEEIELTPMQRLQANCAAKNETHFDKIAIADFLDQLVYPLHHLDFEAMNQAIPVLDNMSPNQFILYQASIHQEEKSGTVTHSEFLHTKKTDAREMMIKYLLEKMPGKGSIIVWSKSFEASRIKELGRQFPQYNDQLLALNMRMIDIRDIFSQNMIYTHAFQGSSSIKYILPVLCPNLSYDRLYIRNGNDSQANYIKLINGHFKGGKYNQIKKALLEYNRLDTLAMLEILKKIKSLMKMKKVVL